MEKSDLKAFLTETISIIVIAVVLSLILRYFVIEARIIPSESMVSTLKIGDRIIVNRFIYFFKDPQRGDIIIFEPPPALNRNDEMFIKRVIGLPGETVEMKNSKVYINGKALNEPYAVPLYYTYGPVTVPQDSLLVLGDNRNLSYDSHQWNAWLTRDRVKGKAMAIFWPVGRAALLERGVSFE